MVGICCYLYPSFCTNGIVRNLNQTEHIPLVSDTAVQHDVNMELKDSDDISNYLHLLRLDMAMLLPDSTLVM